MESRWHDTPAAKLWRLLADLMFVNLLSLICSFGIVTIGASLTGMYAVLFSRERNEGTVSIVKTFFKSFARNFWKATLLELIVVLLIVVAGGDYWYAINMGQPVRTVFTVVAVMVASIAVIVFLMAFPQLASFTNTLKGYLKNSFLLTFAAPWAPLAALAAWVVPWVLAFTVEDLVIELGVLYLLWGFAFPAWISVKVLEKLFQKTMDSGETQNDPA